MHDKSQKCTMNIKQGKIKNKSPHQLNRLKLILFPSMMQCWSTKSSFSITEWEGWWLIKAGVLHVPDTSWYWFTLDVNLRVCFSLLALALTCYQIAVSEFVFLPRVPAQKIKYFGYCKMKTEVDQIVYQKIYHTLKYIYTPIFLSEHNIASFCVV